MPLQGYFIFEFLLGSSSDTFPPVLGQACTPLRLWISKLTHFAVLKSPYSVSRAYSYTASGAGGMLLTKVILGKIWEVNGWCEVSSCPPGFNSVCLLLISKSNVEVYHPVLGHLWSSKWSLEWNCGILGWCYPSGFFDHILILYIAHQENVRVIFGVFVSGNHISERYVFAKEVFQGLCLWVWIFNI